MLCADVPRATSRKNISMATADVGVRLHTKQARDFCSMKQSE